MGLTGIPPNAFIILLSDFSKIEDYKTIIGTTLFINLFPLTFASVYEFYKNDKINYTMGIILFITIILGSYISSYSLFYFKHFFSVKHIKGINVIISFIIFALFSYSYYYEKS